jgi:hypothetical protein
VGRLVLLVLIIFCLVVPLAAADETASADEPSEVVSRHLGHLLFD